MIIPKNLLDVPKLQEIYPNFKAVSDCDREKIEPEMQVIIRSNQEDILVKVEEVTDDYLVGKVLNDHLYFSQPFGYLDFIQFERKNVINIIVINGELY